ncbi:hypothetical protein HTSR_2053 [Halodesulfurarchaeum formicicum]|uniref:Uncharacterized protein n=1 Tax=Halodesulfurarchaeum formicicum TaxID=1873524 RepID=A0A1D8S774_9EURY|nr:hypothetical protein [Halodesulfurarchaeum formicicum]AOW81213.1 hypothetical protein HTSR_2053 [Halodesulfurarchaeum formicicum]APE96556.1 hypothetical protein HSR6_2129 [Halodesulfurarchaeum formicicum]
MNQSGLDTMTVLKVLLAVAAFVVGFVVLGAFVRVLGRLIWLSVGLLVFAVLGLVALRLLRDLL